MASNQPHIPIIIFIFMGFDWNIWAQILGPRCRKQGENQNESMNILLAGTSLIPSLGILQIFYSEKL